MREVLARSQAVMKAKTTTKRKNQTSLSTKTQMAIQFCQLDSQSKMTKYSQEGPFSSLRRIKNTRRRTVWSKKNKSVNN